MEVFMNRNRTLLYGALCAFAVIGALFPSAAGAAEVSDKVIAIVNDDIITMSDLITEGGDDVKGDPATILANGMTVREARDVVLEQIIMKKLLDQGVKKEGLDVTPVEVDRLIAERLKMEGQTKQDLMKILAEDGITYSEYRDEVEYSIKKERIIARKLSSHIIVTDEEIAAYFTEHNAEFKDRKEYRVSEIILPIPPDATESVIADIRAKANMVYNKLKSGASFEAMAKEYSMAPDAQTGGDMGFLQSSTLDPGFIALLSKMKVGQIGDVIASPNGFVIIKVTDTRPISTITVDDVKSEIIAAIRYQKTIAYFDRWMKDLRKSAFVQKML
jgi:peptidyl-prolyl cis-trans isomerase SurA